MTTHIFMNHRIRQAKPDGPVIVAQTGKKVREGNRVDIMHAGVVVASVIYDPKGNPSKTHAVKAWIETKLPAKVS